MTARGGGFVCEKSDAAPGKKSATHTGNQRFSIMLRFAMTMPSASWSPRVSRLGQKGRSIQGNGILCTGDLNGQVCCYCRRGVKHKRLELRLLNTAAGIPGLTCSRIEILRDQQAAAIKAPVEVGRGGIGVLQKTTLVGVHQGRQAR